MTDTLWQSFANANRASLEANAVISAFQSAIDEGALGQVRPSDDEWSQDGWSDDEDWVASYSIESIRIREFRPGGVARGTLAMAVSFFRPEDLAGESWPGARLAKLYVGVAPTNAAWNVDSLVVDGGGRSDVAAPLGKFLWMRPESKQAAWFFCVKLAAIDSRETLEREVLRPLARLLASPPSDAAFEGCEATLQTPGIAS